jgi:hypothetical protein
MARDRGEHGRLAQSCRTRTEIDWIQTQSPGNPARRRNGTDRPAPRAAPERRFRPGRREVIRAMESPWLDMLIRVIEFLLAN